MSDDLVKRLRKLVDTEDMHPLSIFAETIRDAADAIERLTKERDEALSRMSDKDFERTAAELRADAAIARAEAVEAEVARLRQALQKDEHTVVIAYEDGDHQRLARGVGRLQRDNERYRALLREALSHIQDRHGGTFHDLRARIAAAIGDDNGQ